MNRRLRFLSVLLALVLPAFTQPATARREGQLASQPKSEYQARRQKLMQRVKDGVVALVGAREEDLGEIGRFRQKNDFMYLTGVSTPGSFLMLVPANLIPDRPAQEVVFIPPRNTFQERWSGVQIGPGAEAAQSFGVGEVAGADKFYDRLREMLTGPPFKTADGAAARPRLYTIMPKGGTAQLTRENEFIETVKRLVPQVQVQDLSPVLAEMRKLKTPAEIAVLQQAIDITTEAHLDAAAAIKPGAYEYQVQGALEYAFTRNGAERPGFPSIVGSGIYATILHYNDNRKKIEAGDLIVIDIGAEYSYYTADVTRTYPATGKFSPRQREIYQLVLDAQRACEKAFKPGQTSLAQLHQVAVEVMRASPLRDKQGKSLERYFIHGLSHWLGMDVHDVGDYGGAAPAGAVFTIEPGIYIPEEKLGVRIEDDYLVTERGLVKLSGKLPSSPDEIERLMAASQAAREQRQSMKTGN